MEIIKQAGRVQTRFETFIQPNQRRKINSSQGVDEIFRQFWSDDLSFCESFYVAFFDKQNGLMGLTKVSEGGLSSTVVPVKKIMSIALNLNAASIALAHNHPSGNLKASSSDILVTQKVKKACDVMELQLLDHLILTEFNGYLSFADECIL